MHRRRSAIHNPKDAWVVDVNMGYGHSRAAHCLRDLSGGHVLSANDYAGIPERDLSYWKKSRQLYEFVSRLRPVPIIGKAAFHLMDAVQKIPDFYPRRDLSQPNLQVKQIYTAIHHGFGRHLIERLRENPVPLVTTFFATAFMADYFDYPGDIYCVTTDADISRAWVPLDPKKSRIRYFASNGRVVERLQLYGVPESNIFLTGFPLPKELIGGYDAETLKNLLMSRICNLDPKGIFVERYQYALLPELGSNRCQQKTAAHPLTITYSVGGAGAQRQLGIDILHSLKHRIARHEVRLNLVAGVRPDVADVFHKAVNKIGLSKELGEWIRVPVFHDRARYFDGFTELLKTTDVLWTKPSELSFYTGLGLPVIAATPIGSQEEFNRVWLQYTGGGFPQVDPRLTSEWLFDWIASGGVARMAWNGYMEAPTHGTYRIEDMILGRSGRFRDLPMIV